MEYGLTASTLEARDYHSIESPAIRALLPKLGYNRSMALLIVHGPYELGGIGLQDLYSSQGTKKILALLSHICCGSTLGRMLQLDIQWTQHALGVGHNILEEPTKPIPPSIGDTWARGVCHFCIDAGCSMLVPSIRPPVPRHERNIAIMDLALQHNLTDVQLQSVQKLRLYLGVTFVSDICNATGNALLPEILARCPITASQAVELYPRQEAHPRAAWAMFIKHLQLQDLDLSDWLSEWTSHRHWNHIYSPSQGYYWH
jgi:hypothetical protein